jgi:hypothetical protein
MSRRPARLTAPALLILLLLLGALGAPSAGARATSPGKGSCAKAKSKKGRACPKPKKQPKPLVVTPMTATLLDGSVATVDIPAVPLPGGYVIPGTPVTESLALAGVLHGGIPGGYQLNRDNTITLKDAAISLPPADLLKDPACGSASILRLNPVSNVVIDPATANAVLVKSSGDVAGKLGVRLRLAFDSRASAACDAPLTTMGTSESAFPVSLSGKIEKGTGLAALTLDAPPTPITVAVCLTPGAANAPCATPPVGYPVTITVHAVVKVAIG